MLLICSVKNVVIKYSKRIIDFKLLWYEFDWQIWIIMLYEEDVELCLFMHIKYFHENKQKQNTIYQI